MKCGTRVCEFEAENVVHWPGKSLPMCEYCTDRAVSIGDTMGFSVQVDKIIAVVEPERPEAKA